MSLIFQNSYLLPLLLLAVVPLLLHLFARTKPPQYEFSSVEFLRKIVRKTMRLRKPQDILLLILRTLAVLALIGMFLKPLWFSQNKLPGLFEKKNLVLIIDASASMAWVEGSQTRFASACAEASEILSGLSSRDRANVIWLKAEPEAVFPDELASNIGYLKDRVRRAKVSYERGARDKAFQIATKLLADANDGKREICVVSDFQRSGWEGFEPPNLADVTLIHVKIGHQDGANLAVTKMDFEPKRPVVGEVFTITAEVENFSDEEVQTTLFSEVDESRRSENVTVPAGGKTLVSIRHHLGKAGAFPVKVSLAEDSFPADDQRSLVVDVRPYLRVGILSDDDPRTAKMWTRAIQSLGWAVPEWLTEADLENGKTSDFDIIFLAGWKGNSKVTFPPHTTVVCLPGKGDASLAWQQLADKDGGTMQMVLDQKKETPARLSIAKPEDAVFDLFRKGEHGSVEGIAGTSRLISTSPTTGEVLLAWQDGQPALTRVSPKRYWWTIPLSSESNNWAGRVEFVPFLGELILSQRTNGGLSGLGGLESGRNASLDFETGDIVFWQAPGEMQADALEALGPDGNTFAPRAEPGGRFSAGPVGMPGVVEWLSDEVTAGYSSVNFPAIESNLETLTLAEVESRASLAVDGGGKVRDLREGISLWPWLLAAAVGFLMIESATMLWAAKTT